MKNLFKSKLFALLAGAAVIALPMSAISTSAVAQEAMETTAAAGSSAPSYMTATYGDWLLRCTQKTGTIAVADKACEIVHVIRVAAKTADGRASNPQVIAQIAFGTPPDSDSYKVVYQVPASAWLREPLKLKLADTQEAIEDAEGANVQEASFFNCQGNACLADMDLDEEQVAAFAAAKNAQITFTDAAKRTINVPVSLNGFADAYAALQADK